MLSSKMKQPRCDRTVFVCVGYQLVYFPVGGVMVVFDDELSGFVGNKSALSFPLPMPGTKSSG